MSLQRVKNDSLSVVNDSLAQGSNYNNSFRAATGSMVINQASTKIAKFLKLPSKNQNFHEKAKFRRSMHDRMTRSLRVDLDDESLQDEINNPRKMSMAIENTFNYSTVSSQRGIRNKLHRTGSKTSSILKRMTRRQTANACSTIGQKDY